ncbi:hypothetical protein [Massilia scottii]|uniref:hypothetical protein n=1 Tax=Massilia scottii TaxID=3057166 RepID=UPI0027968C6E|nr:hypothetical protein [Massilia sp. CCM 9029]MDQ1832379.1 hypothetical protein [Massilia sp. CCM 9029]
MHKPTSSNTKPNVTWGGVTVILAVLPALIYIAGFWRIHFAPVSLWTGLAAAVVGNVMFAPSMIRTAQRDIDVGMNATLPRGARFPWRDRLMLHAVVGLVFFGWMMSAIWLCARLVAPPLTERVFRVEDVNQCTRSCLECTYSASIVLRFETMTTWICAEDVRPRLREGELILVRGYFHPLMIRIDSVLRAPDKPAGGRCLITSTP